MNHEETFPFIIHDSVFIIRTALVVQRQGHRTRNAATRVRVPSGALDL